MKNLKKDKWWEKFYSFDFLIEVLFLMVIFFMPTIFDRRLGIVFSGTKTTWMRVFAVLLLGTWAIKILVTGGHRFIRTKLDWPVLSYLLACTVATLTSVHVLTSFVGFYGRYEGLSTLLIFGLFFFVTTNYMTSYDKLKRIIGVLIPASSLMALYSIIQRHALDPYMWGGVATRSRVIGTIGQPNFIAAYMLMAFFLLLFVFLKEKKTPQKLDWLEQLFPVGLYLFVQAGFLFMIYNLGTQNVIIWYLGFLLITIAGVLFGFYYEKLHPLILDLITGSSLVLIYICLLYTQSRGGYMGLFAAMVVFALVIGRRWIFRHWKRLSLLSLLIVIISVVTMATGNSPFARFAGEVKVEVKAEQPGKLGSNVTLRGAAGSRGETWKSAFKIISDYPVFGIGPEVLKMIFPRYETEMFRFNEAFHVKQDRCHNETFDVGVTKGLIAFFLYLWLLSTIFYYGLKKAKQLDAEKRLMMGALLAAIFSFLVQNQFSFGVVAITSLFWVMWAMVMNLGSPPTVEEAPEKKKSLSLMDIPWIPVAVVVIIIIFLLFLASIPFRGDIYFKSGKGYLQIKRYDVAAREFNKSVNAFPYDGGPVSHLGIAKLNMAQSAPDKKKTLMASAKILERGMKIDAYNADNFYMMSKIYFMLNQMGVPRAYDKSLKYAFDGIKIDPYYAEIYQNVGLLYEIKGKNKLAAEYYTKAYMINPNLDQARQSAVRAWVRSGVSNGVVNFLKKVVKRYPNRVAPSISLGKYYIEKKQYAKSEEVFLSIRSYHPKNASIAAYVGESYRLQGKFNQALNILRDAVYLDPKDVLAHKALGLLYINKGDRAKARSEFEQVLYLSPDDELAKKALKQL